MLAPEEAEALKHALIEGLDRVKKGGGNRYGHLSLEEAEELIKKLH
jgi:hypothetical protein